MQVSGLGHAVGRVCEREPGGGAAEASEAELAREQVGADEAQRPGEQEQEVVADERGDGARSEERRRAVAEQRVREREAERMRVERVGVEQVLWLMEHGVSHPCDLPSGSHGVAEIGGDAARQVQHQRPGREHGQHHARQRHERQLERRERGRRRPASGPPRLPVARPAALGPPARASRCRRPAGQAIREACAVGWGDRCSWPAGVRDRADRRSIREPPATLRRTAGVRL